MKRAILIWITLLMTGCSHVEWFGGNADVREGEPSMVKVAEIRF